METGQNSTTLAEHQRWSAAFQQRAEQLQREIADFLEQARRSDAAAGLTHSQTATDDPSCVIGSGHAGVAVSRDLDGIEADT